MLAKTILTCAAPALLSGCFYMHPNSSEREYLLDGTPAGACRYSWEVMGGLFRSSILASTPWRPASVEYPALHPRVKELAAACALQPPALAPRATLSADAQHYASAPYKLGITIPGIFISLVTFGLVPVVDIEYVAVCMQATGEDGLHRSAIAVGRITSIESVWYAALKKTRGRATSVAYPRIRDLMLETATEAWHKLWGPEGERAGSKSCIQRLDALAGRNPDAGGAFKA